MHKWRNGTVNSGTAITAATADIDPAVVMRARDGDSEAFRAIVDHYRSRIHATAWRITGNAEDALDVAQDVFVRLHGALRDGALTGSVAGWLYRVTVNAAIDRRRSGVRNTHIGLEDTPEVRAGSGSRPDTAAERSETAEIIRTLAAELPEQQAAVFALRDIEGAAVAEIGGILGISESTVRVHIARARLALRAMLKKRYPYLITGSEQS